jgi:signal transduction histidine kinase/CheY-like chemotaxis protein
MTGTDELAMHLQLGIHAAQSTPLMARSGKMVGMITTHWRNPHTPSERDIRLLDVLARQAADLIERSQSEALLLQTQEQLRAFADHLEQSVEERTQELVHAQDRLRDLAAELTLTEQRERKRLAVDLHDHLQQLLVLGKLKLGQGKQLLPPTPAHAELMQEVDQILTDALAYTRTLVTELSPSVLQEHGLPAALKWLGEYMKRHNLAIVVRVPEHDEIHLPEADALLLFQSVRELLINSAKHAGTHEASVTLTEDDHTLRIEVQDHGQGFDASILADTAPLETPQNPSSKFGLFSIRERMRFLGGKLDITSSEETGTTATLLLPLSAPKLVLEAGPSIEMTPSQRVPQRNAAKESIRVLLVDDHAMVRQGLRTLLGNYTNVDVVGEAANGEQAVRLVEQLHPMVVVMDINMPVMNGIEATRQIRTLRPDVTVVGLSVNAERENQEAMRSAGGTILLTKEAAVDQLYSAIQEAVRYESR